MHILPRKFITWKIFNQTPPKMDIGDVDMEKKVQSKTHLLTCVIYNLDYTVIQVPSQ